MKKIISKIIGLSHVSVLGGYLQFGLGYHPNHLYSGGNTYDHFSIAIGVVTINMYANLKSVNELNIQLNGTSHKMEIKFDWKTFSHCYRKRIGSNSEYKSNLLYSWK